MAFLVFKPPLIHISTSPSQESPTMYKARAFTAITCTTNVHRFHPQIIRKVSISAINMSSISDAINKDHRELEQYYDNIINAHNNDEATRWQNQFTWELARHSIGEELVVYPSFEKKLGDKGKEMANKDRAEHQTVGCFKVLSSCD
jgi:hypothetical protein